MTNDYWENFSYGNHPIGGEILRLVYQCAHCDKFKRYFFVKVSDDRKYLTKVGQYPPWDISSNKNIEQLLDGHADYYKRGLICESQGYGIAAFAYYRRIIEEIISGLLDEIPDLLFGEEKNKYLEALEQTKKTIVAENKIALVKDLLPPILRPQGMNPLSTLHSVLSEGIHSRSEEECLNSAGIMREVLIFFVNQVVASKESSKSFTDGMKKLLDKKNR
jgi:hypothetical protein